MKTQYKHIEASHKAQQRIYLPHVSRAAVLSQAARKLLLQIPPSDNSVIHKTRGKQNKDPKHQKTISAIRSLSITSPHLARAAKVGCPLTPT